MIGNVINVPGYRLKDGKLVKAPSKRQPVSEKIRQRKSKRQKPAPRGFNSIGKA